MDKTKLYKTYNIIIRSVIIILALWFLYDSFTEKNLFLYRDLLGEYLTRSTFLLAIAIVLLMMPLNWGIEAQKWRYIMEPKEEISFWRASKGVLAGASVSSLSPNRIGDFLGRVFVLKKNHLSTGNIYHSDR